MRTAVLTVVVAAASLLAGCKGVPVPTCRAYYNATGPALTRYVQADDSLDEDQKRVRLQAVESFGRVLDEAEK